jgi:hypothetical protein
MRAYSNSDKLPTCGRGPRMRRKRARRGRRSIQKAERERKRCLEKNSSCLLKYTSHHPYSIFIHALETLRIARRHIRGVVALAKLADPAAEIACEVPKDLDQPQKLQSPNLTKSMGPLPASSARFALRQSSHVPSTRLSQVQRHFNTTSPVRKEIQDAYILSAARTPTGKVRDCHKSFFYAY